MSSQRKIVEEYYDELALKKLVAFVKPNPRVESAWISLMESVGQPKRILEIGCGIGDISYRLAQTFHQAQIIGLDISPRSIELANKLFANERLTFHTGKLTELNESGFDLIVMMDVFEHISSDERTEFMSGISKLMNPGAVIFASCPSPEFLAWLRIHSPQHIQPVDEDITVDVISSLARACKLRLHFYKTVSVWFSGDYFHFLLGPDHAITPVQAVKSPAAKKEKSWWYLVTGKSIPPEKTVGESKESRENKLRMIRDRLGDKVTNDLQKLM